MAPGPFAPDFLAIVGPTGSGKTRLSLQVALALGGEVISMDSRQVYRGMDVGTAKATPSERALVPHHGLDILDPGDRYSAGRFGRDARGWIRDIQKRGRVPVLAGGTGFFLKVLTEPLFQEPPLNSRHRPALEGALAALPGSELERWVRVLDPGRAQVAVAGGRQRMLRVLLVTLLTGRPLSWWHRRRLPDGKALRGVICLLDVSRELLNDRINRRVGAMVAGGFADEVARLLQAGFGRGDPGMSGVGYREMADYVEGRISLEGAVQRTRAATRRYAKRQLTWFRGQLEPDAVTVDGTASVRRQLEVVVEAWRGAA